MRDSKTRVADPEPRTPDPGRALCEDSPHPPAFDRRRRLYHADPASREAGVSGRAPDVPRRTGSRTRDRRQSASRRGHRGTAPARAGANRGGREAGAAVAPCALRSRDRSARRTAERLAGVPLRRAVAYRLRNRGTHLDVHARGCPSARTASAPLSRQSVGSARSDRRLAIGRAGSGARYGRNAAGSRGRHAHRAAAGARRRDGAA